MQSITLCTLKNTRAKRLTNSTIKQRRTKEKNKKVCKSLHIKKRIYHNVILYCDEFSHTIKKTKAKQKKSERIRT